MEHEMISEKLKVSEGMIRERESRPSVHKKPEGYEQHPADDRSYEVFGLKNSFDNLSVSADEKGRLTLAVSSLKGFAAPMPEGVKRNLRGSRRRTVYEHFGEFFTEPASRGEGAFAFRTRKNLSDVRILRDFKSTAQKHIAPAGLEALPFLTLERDKEQLSQLRSRDGRSSADTDEKLALEQTVIKKTELENRFIRRLRIARRMTVFPKQEEFSEYDFFPPVSALVADENEDPDSTADDTVTDS